MQPVLAGLESGTDPLGEFFLRAVPARERRLQGATFTPDWLIELQLNLVQQLTEPTRVIDPGAGSGRYAMAAARRWPKASIIAVENDPGLAEAIAANAEAIGVKIDVVSGDFLRFELPVVDGPTAFVGNPPYVRHHAINRTDKDWFTREMKRLGLPASQLSGLHVLFYLKCHLLSKPGDVGTFVTAAEWLETRYGAGMRALFRTMGGVSLIRANPAERIFRDALTTSAITCWQSGSDGAVQVSDLVSHELKPAFETTHAKLQGLSKWPGFGRPLPRPSTSSSVLGDVFRIARGQVTGCNHVWIATPETARLIPERYLIPCVTDASDIIRTAGSLADASRLRRVIDLPEDLTELNGVERAKVEEFLNMARSQGAADGYIARHRRPWWKVRLGPAPAVVMTYMGRRPPVFAANTCGARLLNIAHGLHPRIPLRKEHITAVVAWLNENVSPADGRTYGGGLVKFEPADAMAIPLPESLMLRAA